MSSIASTLFGLGMDAASLLASLIITSVDSATRTRGGKSWKVNEAFEKIASYGLMPNMIFYLMKGYHMELARASSILLFWAATSNSMSIVGAFLSDSYMGRFHVIALGSISSLVGTTLLWLTTMIPHFKPLPCDQFFQKCNPPTPLQLVLLFSSFGFISIGAGCIRPCSIAFGADQLAKRENPRNERALQSYFNWYYASIGVSTIFAFTVLVYVQDQFGWKVGFGLPVILMFCSAFMFLLGSSLYIKVKPSNSLLTGFIQVLVVAFKNRKLDFPTSNNNEYYFHGDDSNLLAPTNKLRFLNKACIANDFERDKRLDGSASDAWRLCTIGQVESLKALLRVFPIWSTGIVILLSLHQHSFLTLQANTMDRHLTSNFQIPAASFTGFYLLSITLWVVIYDRIMLPLLAKHTGKPRGLSTKTRMGMGLLISCAAMALAATVESKRRRMAIEEGYEENPRGVINMSAMWLVPQLALLGLAEAFNAIGQIEFYYSKFPKSMSSIAVAIFTLEMSVGNLVASLMVNTVNRVTEKDGKTSWLSTNLNKGHLDYYYWLITTLGVLNFGYFIFCCWIYGPTDEQNTLESGEEEKRSAYRDLPSS
ncbi:Proton-dependent oligopeptide transporter family [Dillenia turbinata]|uniref:Proton-dependent oligopeptide transporter family n=1 Tax=Dillenia turbinata TaxID=194707 RepID=A0AAN8VC84_9MAGN